MSKNIEIYTTDTCPFCKRAKDLLTAKKVAFKNINVEAEADRKKMIERTGGPRSVPQIFIDGLFLPGGCDGLMERDKKGELNALLGLS